MWSGLNGPVQFPNDHGVSKPDLVQHSLEFNAIVGVFNEGELFTIYSDWHVIERKATFWKMNTQAGYVIAILINKLVAQRP
ncbi:MAG: hypothetical protein WAM39_12220 [Bryobacteraceae bacterium]